MSLQRINFLLACKIFERDTELITMIIFYANSSILHRLLAYMLDCFTLSLGSSSLASQTFAGMKDAVKTWLASLRFHNLFNIRFKRATFRD